MRIWSVSAFLLSTVLCGCINAQEERQIAVAEAYDRCAKQGKQPQVVDLHQQGIANVTPFHTALEFKCVGPGDPGYSAPQGSSE